MPPSSSGLGHHPFKVTARVRIPLGVPGQFIGPVVKLEFTPACQAGGRGFESRRDRSRRAQPAPASHGRVAQSAERPPEKRKVTGSTPVSTTKETPGHEPLSSGSGLGFRREGGSVLLGPQATPARDPTLMTTAVHPGQQPTHVVALRDPLLGVANVTLMALGTARCVLSSLSCHLVCPPPPLFTPLSATASPPHNP